MPVGVPWLESAGLGHLMSIPKPLLPVPEHEEMLSQLPTGGKPVPAVSFCEEHFLPAHASEKSGCQTVTNDQDPLRAKAGWDEGRKCGSQGSYGGEGKAFPV